MSGNEIRKKYLEYMEARGHTVIPSAALVPENDPTTLFTGSGMQPLVPFLLGEPHPKGTRLTDSQKCFRAEDIEEVGDNRHTTFFEMLGNWSLGDYFKKEQLPWFFTFMIEEIGLDPNNIYITVFAGDEGAGIPKDIESAEIWQELLQEQGVTNNIAEIGSEAAGYDRGMREKERIFYYDASKNWWSRAGAPDEMPSGEIGGPDSEVFYDFGTPHDPSYGEHCHPNCDCGRFLEIGNSVFMEYIKNDDGTFKKLPKQNVDFGGGLERITAAQNGTPDIFQIDLLKNVIDQIETLSGKAYSEHQTPFRVITDHVRGAVFMIGDGVFPSNTEQGYFVRRLLRRSVRYADTLDIEKGKLAALAASVISTYQEHYPSLKDQHETIVDAIEKEEAQFRKTLEKGLKVFNKINLSVNIHAKRDADGKLVQDTSKKPEVTKTISGKHAFELFSTYGFPIELTEEVAAERGFEVDRKGFDEEMKKHQERSRAGAEAKFKGGLADSSEKVVQYHTVTHLLLAALREILGEHVHQAGSNITAERLRFDFTHDEKVERETLDQIEAWVNNAIQTGGTVSIESMAKTDAEVDPTVEGSFWERYPDTVNVYEIAGNDGTRFSRELCGGPHVKKLEDITGTFRIKKEESSARGVRRIKAVLE